MESNNKKTAKTREETASADDLRAQFVPGSQVIPDRSLFHERFHFFTPARLISLIILVVLLALGWLLFAGPLRPWMESQLTELSERVSQLSQPAAEANPDPFGGQTPSPTFTAYPPTPSYTPTTGPQKTAAILLFPTSSPIPSESPTPTAQPTETPTATMLPSSSIVGCIPASLITPGDVGQTLCVTGNVIRTESNPNAFLIIVENSRDSFYFLSYDRKWENLEKEDCVFATGEILQLGNNPVMILDYKVPIQYCP